MRWLSTVEIPGAEAAAACAAVASWTECTCPYSFAVWSDTLRAASGPDIIVSDITLGVAHSSNVTIYY